MLPFECRLLSLFLSEHESILLRSRYLCEHNPAVAWPQHPCSRPATKRKAFFYRLEFAKTMDWIEWSQFQLFWAFLAIVLHERKSQSQNAFRLSPAIGTRDMSFYLFAPQDVRKMSLSPISHYESKKVPNPFVLEKKHCCENLMKGFNGKTIMECTRTSRCAPDSIMSCAVPHLCRNWLLVDHSAIPAFIVRARLKLIALNLSCNIGSY